MTVQDVYNWIDLFAPFASQEGFDNAGLLLGDPDAEVRRVFFTLDATLPIIQEAVAWGADLLITHHPLMFGGIKAIRYHQPEGQVLSALIRDGLNLIAAHTNLDKAEGGTGDSLAAAVGLTGVRPIGEDPYLRMGTLPSPTPAVTLLRALNAALGSQTRMYGHADTMVQQVVVGAGAIGEAYATAAQNGAQAFVVGEIKHHELLGAQALGTIVYELGHYASEQPGIAALYQRFQSAAQAGRWPIQARLTAITPFDCAT